MKTFVLLALAGCLTVSACRKRKAEPAPAPETTPPPAVTEPAAPVASTAAPPVKDAPPVNVGELEAGPEFADLNNLVSWFYDRNKRVPTMQELSKMYSGPLPNPPGYKLVIDPKTKTVMAVR